MRHEFTSKGETNKVRDMVLLFIDDLPHGLDIGYGGSPIKETAITIDLPRKGRTYFGSTGTYPQHLEGDARNLYWFKDEVFDYVYSSHLVEDFEDPCEVLEEWTRVLKIDGYLALALPDEKLYKAHCERTGGRYNFHHKNPDMSLVYMEDYFKQEYADVYKVVFGAYVKDDYTFAIIAKKKANL